tara:strand:+ start:1567 stop:2058 length:492 start_codon:yes stop_codon:yes gene_type:complete
MTWVTVDIGDVELDIDVREIARDVAEHLDIRDEVMSVLRDEDLNEYIDDSDMRDTAREELYEYFDDALEDNDEFTELRHTVQRLVEHLALPEERTGEEQIQYLIESGQITLANLETIVANQCGEWRSNMKKMNKADLLETAQRMGYHLNSDMTIAQIHEAVGL